MLTKPFVFVVQVVATIFGTEAAEYKSVLTDPSHGWKELHGIEIPLRGHRCPIEEAALSLVPTPTHAPTSVTSATSDLPTAIRSHVPPSNFSGPGSGTQGEMLTKPFVFVVQVVATIFGTEAAEYKSVLTDPSHGWKELHGIEIPLRVADNDPGSTRIASKVNVFNGGKSFLGRCERLVLWTPLRCSSSFQSDKMKYSSLHALVLTYPCIAIPQSVERPISLLRIKHEVRLSLNSG
ncbi:hypothetical protein MRX96_015394 [Rhipicephalus microplus]